MSLSWICLHELKQRKTSETKKRAGKASVKRKEGKETRFPWLQNIPWRIREIKLADSARCFYGNVRRATAVGGRPDLRRRVGAITIAGSHLHISRQLVRHRPSPPMGRRQCIMAYHLFFYLERLPLLLPSSAAVLPYLPALQETQSITNRTALQ